MKKLIALLFLLPYLMANSQTILGAGGNQVSGSNLIGSPIFGNSANKTLPSLPLASGALVMRIGHSFIGFEDTIDSQTGTTASADNYDYAGGSNLAWTQWPDFNIEAWYDSSTKNNFQALNGSNLGYPGDHLETAGGGAVPGCWSRWQAAVISNANIIIDDCVLNTINSGDTSSPPNTNVTAITAYIEAEILKHIALAAQYGKWIIEPELTPVGYWGTGDSRFTVVANINAFIDGLTQSNVKIWPRYNAMLNADLTQNVNLFDCDGSTTLSSAITSTGQTALTVVNGTSPSIPLTGTFAILVGLGTGTVEQMQVISGAGTNNWTVTRGTEGTTPTTFVSGSSICSGFIHPNPQGAKVIGNTLVTLLQTMISAGPIFNQDATQSANLLTNGGMTGTTGTCNSTGISGTVATSWTAGIFVNRGSTTAVCSQTTIDGTHTKNTITVTPGNTSTNYDEVYFKSTNISTKLPMAGQCSQAYVHITTGSNPPSRIRMIYVLAQVGTTPAQTSIGFNDSSNTYVYPGLPNFSGWIRSNIIKTPRGGLSNILYYVYGIASNTGSAYAYSIDNPIVLNVPCPWLAWGLQTATP